MYDDDWKICVSALSPFLIITLLVFVSGIPLLEKSADEKYGGIEDYRIYKNSTSPLILLPRSLWIKFNSCLKSLCCEFSLYWSTEKFNRN